MFFSFCSYRCRHVVHFHFPIAEGAIDLTHENSFVSTQFKRTHPLFKQHQTADTSYFHPALIRRELSPSSSIKSSLLFSPLNLFRGRVRIHTPLFHSPYEIHPADCKARSRAVPELLIHFLFSTSGHLEIITTPSWSAQSHCHCCLSEPTITVREASLSPSRRR
jgi:hypothetical protein